MKVRVCCRGGILSWPGSGLKEFPFFPVIQT
jgi:hypothetical protein